MIAFEIMVVAKSVFAAHNGCCEQPKDRVDSTWIGSPCISAAGFKFKEKKL